MITYSHAVEWIWTLAVVATLVVFVRAWSAIVRADGATGELRGQIEGLAVVPDITATLHERIEASAVAHRGLAQRAGAGAGDGDVGET